MFSMPSFLAASSNREKDLPKEYDNNVRDADVYLFTRPVNNLLPDKVEFHHWALVFNFTEDGDYRTVEGIADEEGDRLIPSYTKECPRLEGHYFRLGKVMISPFKLWELTKTNIHNYSIYLAAWQNCQVWVKEIAEELGQLIATKIKNFKTLREARPIWATVAKMSSGLSKSSKSMS